MKCFRIMSAMCCVLMFAQVGFAQDKIGVVDIQAIVNNSSEVRALKQEHTSQIQALNKIVTDAQNAIAKESDPQKIVMLQDKYAAEFNNKKQSIDSNYQSRLSAIETKLKRDILESAKKNNYDMVLAKSVVFYGGEDITDIVARDIK
ncbi:MAG: OmpH family outer membrane protein [Candidatus Gastranaerophilales bacterium]|nr:OmpH family outer membrane protein [Candidatus Gastranaerophilales bacterium]